MFRDNTHHIVIDLAGIDASNIRSNAERTEVVYGQCSMVSSSRKFLHSIGGVETGEVVQGFQEVQVRGLYITVMGDVQEVVVTGFTNLNFGSFSTQSWMIGDTGFRSKGSRAVS